MFKLSSATAFLLTVCLLGLLEPVASSPIGGGNTFNIPLCSGNQQIKIVDIDLVLNLLSNDNHNSKNICIQTSTNNLLRLRWISSKLNVLNYFYVLDDSAVL
ncbi:hypothetical protein GALMADRAFT_215918 [Galerina marginata CBS 339.88]|uniref:Uncharacterized protein n=1 Tax=Galerina marginata (strain CBS 339.88) TaxID=685588 RepID=A0A067SKG1_GALM3|nr:hypothetical protein GALMADRAFT_215918 [Galerina marginata CBS 339.88]